jgi:hypothetical protein
LDGGVAVTVLRNLGVELRSIRQAIARLVQSGPPIEESDDLPGTPRAKNVIEYALEESRNFKHNCIGSEHILLGLLREQEGVAGVVLRNLGLRIENVRAEIENVLAQPTDWGRPELSGVPPLRPVEDRGARAVEVPAACPKCRVPGVVRVLWRPLGLSDKNLEDIEAGKAILGFYGEMEGPPWVCLHCSPRWSEVHVLAMQDYRLQVAKEEAIAAADFENAARQRDAQVDLRRRLRQLIQELLQNKQ